MRREGGVARLLSFFIYLAYYMCVNIHVHKVHDRGAMQDGQITWNYEGLFRYPLRTIKAALTKLFP